MYNYPGSKIEQIDKYETTHEAVEEHNMNSQWVRSGIAVGWEKTMNVIEKDVCD